MNIFFFVIKFNLFFTCSSQCFIAGIQSWQNLTLCPLVYNGFPKAFNFYIIDFTENYHFQLLYYHGQIRMSIVHVYLSKTLFQKYSHYLLSLTCKFPPKVRKTDIGNQISVTHWNWNIYIENTGPPNHIKQHQISYGYNHWFPTW